MKICEKTDKTIDSIEYLHCSGRQSQKIFATVMPFGALTDRLSCGHSETGQTKVKMRCFFNTVLMWLHPVLIRPPAMV
jgi:hypothetical protein